MASTIITKNGSGAPLASDLVQGELAVDLTNKRLYTEDSGGTVIEVGTNPTSITTGGLTVANTSVIAGDFSGGTAATYIRVQDPTDNWFYGSNVSLGGFLFKNETADVNRFMIGSNGDLFGYNATGTAKLFWDASAESLKINNVAEQTDAHLLVRKNGNNIEFGHANTTSGYYGTIGTNVTSGLPFIAFSADATSGAGNTFNTRGFKGNVLSSTTTGDLTFSQATNASALGQTLTERMRIDSSGNVGIGTSSPSSILHLGSGANATETITVATSSGGEVQLKSTSSTSPFTFVQGSSGERARIDSSGNLLVGVTTNSSSIAGVTAGNGGLITACRSANYSGIFNRLTSDGDIVQFRKDGTTVGSIGSATNGTEVYFSGTGANTSGIFCSNGNAVLSTKAGTLANGTQDLGSASYRWKDLYLSGGVIANGVTTTANVWTSTSNSTLASKHMVFANPNGNVGDIRTNGTATAYITSSDYRLKENVTEILDASSRVLALKPCRFSFIADPSTVVDGFLAHEVQEVVPEAIAGVKDGMRTEEYEVSPAVEATYDEEGNELTPYVPAVMGTREVPDYQGIDHSKLVPLLTAALQEALERIAALEAKVG